MIFNSMFGIGVKKTGQDLSRVTEDIYTEIQPYAVDVKTGQFLNKTSNAIVKKTGIINIQEKIQSYANDVDIYRILERFAMSGDESILNRRIGSFADIVDLPDNVNEFNAYMDKYIAELKKHDKDIAQMILNDKISTDEIVKLIDKRIAEKVQVQQGGSQ